MECDDEQMIAHISELLTELSQRSTKEEKIGEEGAERDTSDKEETMDVS